MKCPKCGKEIADNSQFCEFCGAKLNFVPSIEAPLKKVQRKSKRWMIISIFLLILNIVLVSLAFHYHSSLYSSNSYHINYENELNSEIKVLKSQLPQMYKTKYGNQSIYIMTHDSKFKLHPDGLSWNEKGTSVVIYTESKGYGLTMWGWIPMKRLERY